MFVLHSSNRTENLLLHLKAVLTAQPLASPMQRELFLIQSQGMERWLSQQLADHFKVWGHFWYGFPAKFFNQVADLIETPQSGDQFDRHRLLWRIEAVLRHLDAPVYAPIRRYLSVNELDLKRYQLARQLARLFDQYQLLRPDWLQAWQEGKRVTGQGDEHWQQALWQALINDTDQPHRGARWLSAIETLNHHQPGYFADRLPQRVSVFGVNSLPPLLLAFLQALARHMDVHFYLLNPVQGYWADLPSKALAVKLAEFDGHPLLVRFGQQGRGFQQLLLEQVQFEFEPSSFEASDAANNLQQLQNDLLNNTLTHQVLQVDDSISIHACHSRLREVQILKNQILATLERHPQIQLRDVVVMAPDIQQYTPYINAVFDDIAYAVADRSLRNSNWALDGLVGFIRLSQSRMGWQAVLDLLELDAVTRRFGLNADDLLLIRHWVADLNVRWARDAQHKQDFGLPLLNANTWLAALERLFMGYAVAADADFVDGILPYTAIEGGSAHALGGLNDFLQTLFRAAEYWAQPATLAQWFKRLMQCVEQLFEAAEPGDLQPLYELLAELSELAELHQQPVSWQVMVAWLEGRMDEHISANGFLRGQLTFCSMLPMRSIPFQVIGLLGMNDGEFPKIDRAPTFDLISQQARLGDRSSRADDRYQFLEVLLSARQQLIATFVGQSMRDNSPLPPSVVISELLDVLQDAYQLRNLITYHPLHPFSQRYFNDQTPELFSYQVLDCETAQRLQQQPELSSIWWQGLLDGKPAEAIEIASLMRFYQQPQRYFLRQCLGVRLPNWQATDEEREPFALDGLQHYQIMQDWLAESLHHQHLSPQRLQAQGRWPQAALGELEWQQRKPQVEQFVQQIAALNLGEPLPPVMLDLAVGHCRLVGTLGHRYQNGSLWFRLSSLKAKDFMQAWLHHVLINQVSPQNTYLVSSDAMLKFTPEIIRKDDLEGFVQLYQEGCQNPAAFFSEAVFYFVQQSEDSALAATRKYWGDLVIQGWEPEISQLLTNSAVEELLDRRFEELCRDWLCPVWRQITQATSDYP